MLGKSRFFRRKKNRNASDRWTIPEHLKGKLSPQTLKGLKEQFIYFDKDESGAMEIQELGTLLRASGLNPLECDLKDMVKSVDEDKSGTVEFAEFVDLWYQQVRVGATDMAVFACAFQYFDKDGNGEISQSEFKSVLCGLGEPLTGEEADLFFSQVDADGSGGLNYAEFLSFLESENTVANDNERFTLKAQLSEARRELIHDKLAAPVPQLKSSNSSSQGDQSPVAPYPQPVSPSGDLETLSPVPAASSKDPKETKQRQANGAGASSSTTSDKALLRTSSLNTKAPDSNHRHLRQPSLGTKTSGTILEPLPHNLLEPLPHSIHSSAASNPSSPRISNSIDVGQTVLPSSLPSNRQHNPQQLPPIYNQQDIEIESLISKLNTSGSTAPPLEQPVVAAAGSSGAARPA